MLNIWVSFFQSLTSDIRIHVVISLQKYPFIDILPEPLEKWTNLEGNDMLGLIYEDPKRWGLAQV